MVHASCSKPTREHTQEDNSAQTHFCADWDYRTVKLIKDTQEPSPHSSHSSCDTSDNISWHTADESFSQRDENIDLHPVRPRTTNFIIQSDDNISDDIDIPRPNIPMATRRRQSHSITSHTDSDNYRDLEKLFTPMGYNFAAASILSDVLAYNGKHGWAFNWMFIMLFTGILFGIHDCGEFIVQRENQGNLKHRFFHSPCKKVFKAIKHINETSAFIRTLSSHFRPLFYVLSYTGTLGTGLGDMFQHKYNDLYKTEEPTVVDHLSSGIILTLLTVSAIVYFLWVCYKEKHKGQADAISPPAMEEQADTTRAA